MIYDVRKPHKLMRVFVNGVEVNAIRCRTGIRAYAIVYRKENGDYLLRNDCLVKQKLRGRVQVAKTST